MVKSIRGLILAVVTIYIQLFCINGLDKIKVPRPLIRHSWRLYSYFRQLLFPELLFCQCLLGKSSAKTICDY